MLGAGEPAGEFEPTAVIGGEFRFRFLRGLNDLNEAAWNRLAECEVIATDVDGQFLENLGRFRHGQRRGQIGEIALRGHHSVLQRADLLSDLFGTPSDGFWRQRQEAGGFVQLGTRLVEQGIVRLVFGAEFDLCGGVDAAFAARRGSGLRIVGGLRPNR